MKRALGITLLSLPFLAMLGGLACVSGALNGWKPTIVGIGFAILAALCFLFGGVLIWGC